ncbi:hypothetical protein BGX38DRAFT_1163503, partial [Terfezia claveryi]
MKFITLLFSAALIAGAAAQTSTTTSSAPVNSDSSYGPVVDKCLKTCKPESTTYVSCTATCLGNPNPTSEQVIENTKCSAACPQGNRRDPKQRPRPTESACGIVPRSTSCLTKAVCQALARVRPMILALLPLP